MPGKYSLIPPKSPTFFQTSSGGAFTATSTAPSAIAASSQFVRFPGPKPPVQYCRPGPPARDRPTGRSRRGDAHHRLAGRQRGRARLQQLRHAHRAQGDGRRGGRRPRCRHHLVRHRRHLRRDEVRVVPRRRARLPARRDRAGHQVRRPLRGPRGRRLGRLRPHRPRGQPDPSRHRPRRPLPVARPGPQDPRSPRRSACWPSSSPRARSASSGAPTSAPPCWSRPRRPRRRRTRVRERAEPVQHPLPRARGRGPPRVRRGWGWPSCPTSHWRAGS